MSDYRLHLIKDYYSFLLYNTIKVVTLALNSYYYYIKMQVVVNDRSHKSTPKSSNTILTQKKTDDIEYQKLIKCLTLMKK